MLLRMCRSVVVLALGLAVVLPLAAAPPAFYLRVAPPGAEKPTIFISFSSGKLRVATSPEGLSKAKPLSPSSKFGTSRSQSSGFPEVALPAPADVKVTARFLVSQRGAADASFLGTYRISQRDKAGATWEYSVRDSERVKGGKSPAEAPVVTLPQMAALALSVETKVEGQSVRVGLRTISKDTAIEGISKNGKSIPARVQVLDAKGKVVSDKKATLGDFGFT